MQSKHFVIKKSNGIVYNFYLSQTSNICYKMYSLYNNEKTDPFEVIISEEKVLEFYVNIDTNDTIYLLILCSDGSLKYFSSTDDNWHSKLLFQFDLRSNIVNSLFIYSNEKKLYILYAAASVINTSLWTIYFKSWNGSKWQNSNVSMVICEKEEPPYFITVDSLSNIHLIYKNISNKNSQIFYRKFHTQFALWSTPEKLISTAEPISFYNLFCDANNMLHLTYCSKGSNYKILYKRINSKILNHKNIDKIITIDSCNTSYLHPLMMQIEKKIWIVWKNENGFYASKIDDRGLSCNAPINIPCNNIGSSCIVHFYSNYQIEKNKFLAYILHAINNDFIDFIIPESYSCGYYENSSLNDNPIDHMNPIKENDISINQTEEKNDNLLESYNNLSLNILKEIEELKLEIKSQAKSPLSEDFIIDMKNELKTELLEHIDTLFNNSNLINLIDNLNNSLDSKNLLSILNEIKTLSENLMDIYMKNINEIVSNKELAELESLNFWQKFINSIKNK